MPPNNPNTKKSHQELHQNHPFLVKAPLELQVRTFTYLRADDLSSLQQTSKYFTQPDLIHAIVAHVAGQVYPAKLTKGFSDQAVQSDINNKKKKSKPGDEDRHGGVEYTLEHLRNMELLVIARVLNSPEPSSGYIVSKSWCKSALKWLEATQTTTSNNSSNSNKSCKKKVSKKKQRMRDRKLSDASPPWPNVNSDLLCEHLCLSRCSNGKSARARRRYVDKQAWKILKKLYPDSTSLDAANGECLQCIADAEMVKKTQRDEEEALRLERKQPLSDPILRRFYTRRTGVPAECVKKSAPQDSVDHQESEKVAARSYCSLKNGVYYIVPRAWCHQWRRYMRTGEGGKCGAPDAGSLVCGAHRMLLLPPHLEAFLEGTSQQLLASNNNDIDGSDWTGTNSNSTQHNGGIGNGIVQSPVGATRIAPMMGNTPGQPADQATVQAMLDAGLTDEQIGQQLSALQILEQQRLQQNVVMLDNIDAPVAVSAPSKNELLDRENHSVVEILSKAEYKALESYWPPGSSFGLRLEIEDGRDVWCAQRCRECDATGRSHDVHIRNRARRPRVKKSADKMRTPASLEY